MVFIDDKRAIAPHYMLRSLVRPVRRITGEHAGQGSGLSTVGAQLSSEAEAFASEYDAIQATAQKNAALLGEADRELEVVSGRTRAWLAVIAGFNPNFSDERFRPARETPAETLRVANLLRSHLGENTELLSDDMRNAAVEELSASIESASIKLDAARNAEAAEQQQRASVREVGMAYERKLRAYRRMLKVNFGPRYLPYRELDPMRHLGPATSDEPEVDTEEVSESAGSGDNGIGDEASVSNPLSGKPVEPALALGGE